MGKCTVAAGVSWFIASDLMQAMSPAFAPFTAVMMVQATVYRSIAASWRYIAAVTAGVVVQGALGFLAGPAFTTFLLVALVALTLSRWPALGEQRTYVATAAFFAFSQFTMATDAAGRLQGLVEIVLLVLVGCLVGVAVNLLLLPPLRYRSADEGSRSSPPRSPTSSRTWGCAAGRGRRHRRRPPVAAARQRPGRHGLPGPVRGGDGAGEHAAEPAVPAAQAPGPHLGGDPADRGRRPGAGRRADLLPGPRPGGARRRGAGRPLPAELGALLSSLSEAARSLQDIGEGPLRRRVGELDGRLDDVRLRLSRLEEDWAGDTVRTAVYTDAARLEEEFRALRDALRDEAGEPPPG
ncbi:aromatic acid exporter family protein [Nocardiopsis composta]